MNYIAGDIEKSCALCRFSLLIPITGDILCRKKGVVHSDYGCRKFVYDPLKRIPRRLPGLSIPDGILPDDF